MRDVSRFTDFIQAHIEKTDDNRVFIDKETTRKVAVEANVDLPQLYQLLKSAKDIDFKSLPDCFVVKPTRFASKEESMFYLEFRINSLICLPSAF